MQEIIPVMHCFDNNYVIPAAVSFYSMLKNASKEYYYKLFVLHDDITEDNISRLSSVVDSFENASIEFINTNGLFADMYKARGKDSFSKEVFYKFLPPIYFPQFDKIIITDVDVIFCGDISEEYTKFDIDESDKECYLAGNARHFESYKNNIMGNNDSANRYNKEVLAGYWIFNLRKMRQDNMYDQFISYAWANVNNLGNPEQEVVNYCCYPHVKILPPNTIISARSYGLKMYENDKELREIYILASEKPLQIHFSESRGKVWNKICTPKWDVWLWYLKCTSFYEDYLINLQEAVDYFDSNNTILKVKIPFRKRFFSISCTGFRENRKTKMLRTKWINMSK